MEDHPTREAARIERVALHSRLVAGRELDYDRRHARVPDAMADELRRVGIREWTIWRSGRDLFHYLEVRDAESAFTQLADSPVNADWQATIGGLVEWFAPPSTPPAPGLRRVWRLTEQLPDPAPPAPDPAPGHPPRPTVPAAVLLDCDGTLLETSGCWDDAYREVASELELELPGSLHDHLHGADLPTAAGWFERSCAASGIPVPPTAELVAKLATALAASYGRNARPRPGVTDLLGYLEATGRPTAVATNAPTDVVEAGLAATGLQALIGPVIGRDRAPRGKPYPDLYLAAAAALGVDAAGTLAVEDSGVGVRAAREAGCWTIAVGPQAPRPPASDRWLRCLADVDPAAITAWWPGPCPG